MDHLLLGSGASPCSLQKAERHDHVHIKSKHRPTVKKELEEGVHRMRPGLQKEVLRTHGILQERRKQA